MEEASRKINAKGWFEKHDVHDRAKRREGVQTIAIRNIRPPPLRGTKPD